MERRKSARAGGSGESGGSPSSPLLRVRITRLSSACPFADQHLAFSLAPAATLWLHGPSGVGKSSTASHLAGLRNLPGADVALEWNAAVPCAERVGFLFQKGVLIDALTLSENVALALAAARRPPTAAEIEERLRTVGLSLREDGAKMPGELSGGMLRRAALAQVLAQRKRVIILDEPFVGLDPPVALEIADLLTRIAERERVAFVLITHMEALAERLQPALTVELHMPLASRENVATSSSAAARGTDVNPGSLSLSSRIGARALDYFGYSLPLVVSAFVATGAAVSMLLADMLQRLEVVELVASFLARSMAGSPALPMIMQMVNGIVRQNEAAAKRKLYCLAMSAIFSIELGPLITALLMAGRIGGAYAGELGMMAATSQLDVLRLLGISLTRWTFVPALTAALVAVPLLSAAGTAVGLGAGAVVGAAFGVVDVSEYASEVRAALFDWPDALPASKYPPFVNCYRSLGFALATLLVAHTVALSRRHAQPRHVPLTITTAVVLSCLAVLLLDWAFSQFYVRVGDQSALDGASMESLLGAGGQSGAAHLGGAESTGSHLGDDSDEHAFDELADDCVDDFCDGGDEMGMPVDEE